MRWPTRLERRSQEHYLATGAIFFRFLIRISQFAFRNSQFSSFTDWTS